MKIPQAFVQDLLNRIDIVDVIDPIVPLKRAGANLVACCPFHAEKTPSFTVSQAKQFYHCFGCGAHGSAIGFLMEHLGMGFVDAVRDLAARVGMVIPEPEAGSGPSLSRDRTSVLLEVLEQAAQFYRKALRQSSKAVDYLKRRGLSGEIAARYGIGYAPDGWRNLEAVFPRYDSEHLSAAGLVIEGEGGRRYDRFRDRIMFPIQDVQGRTIGFGGRVLDVGEPKYLNSPETPLFEKGREVYGLFLARQAIRSAGRAVVVEGYMDVVSLAQYGVQYAVATLGTATTPVHVQKLLRQTDELVFCFDGDTAGRKAAWRALENSLGQIRDNKHVRFLFLPDGEDPDSYVRKHGAARFEALLSSEALPLSAYVMRELSSRVDLGTPEGKARFMQEIKPLLAQISAPMLSLMMRKRAAEVAGLSETEASREFRGRPLEDKQPTRHKAPSLRSPFRTLLELLVYRPALLEGHPELRELEDDGLDLLEISEQEREFFKRLTLTPVARASLAERFRDTDIELLAREVEGASIEWEGKGLDAGGLEHELAGTWRAVRDQVRKARQRLLLARLGERQWTSEEKEQFRLLQQPVQ